MSRVNTQGLLRVNPIGPDVAPTIEQPDYQTSRFEGGSVKVGQAAQQVGPSSEAAMYGALAEIAGGLQKGLTNFAEIGSQIEKNKIAQAEVEFEKIDNSDDLPQDKFNKFDEILRNTSTPLLGNTWREKFTNKAQRSWLSDDALNQFEEQRYNRELTQFLNRKENKNRQGTPELLETFNSEYQAKYPTAEYNNWFKVKSFETSSKVIQNKIEDAVSAVGPSVETMYPVPSETEVSAIINGNTEIASEYDTFLQIKANMPSNLVEFEKAFLLKTERELTEMLGPNTPPEVLVEVKQQLSIIGKAKAKQLWRATREMSYLENQQRVAVSLAAADQRLKDAPDKIEAINFYMDTTSRELPQLNAPLTAKREAAYGLVTLMVDTLNSAVTSGTDADLIAKYPNWNKLAPHERIDIAVQRLEEWSSNNPEKRKRFLDALGFTQEEATLAGYSSIEEYAEAMLIENGRTKAISNPSTNEALKGYVGSTSQDVNTTISALGVYQNQDEMLKRANTTLGRLANELGISVNSLQKTFTNSDGSLSLDIDINKWFQELPPEEKQQIRNRGFHLNQFEHLKTYRTLGHNLQVAVNTRGAKLQTTGTTQSDKIYDVPAISKAASKWSLIQGGPNDNFKFAWADGSFAESENNEFKTTLYAYLEDKRVVEDALRENRKVTEFTPNEVAALSRMNALADEFPAIKEYAIAINEVEMEFFTKSTRLVSNIPEPNSTTPKSENLKTLTSIKIEEMFNDLVRGNIKFSPETIPTAPVNPDGTWSADSLFNFTVLQFKAERALISEAPDKERQWYSQSFTKVLDRLAQEKDLSTPQAKYLLVELALLGRAYKEASVNGAPPIFHGSHAMTSRAIIAGNWAEETDVDLMLNTLNNPETKNKLDATLSIARGLAIANNNQRQYPVGSTLVETSYGAQQIVVRDQKILKLASALASQPIGTELEKGIWYSGTVRPDSPDWSSQILVDQLTENGIKTDKETLARQMRFRVLSAYPIDQVLAMTEDQQIQAGAMVLQTIYEENPNLLFDTLEIATGPVGINNPNVNDDGKTDKLDLFFHILEVGLDVDNRSSSLMDRRRVGVSPINSLITAKGTVQNTGGNLMTIPQPVFTVYGNSDSSSWTNSAYNVIAETGIRLGSDSLDWRETKNKLEKEYPPARLIGSSAEQVGKADGTNYLLGAMVLDMPPVADQGSRFSMIENWAAAHGIGSLEEVFIPEDSRYPSFNPDQLFAKQQRTIVKEILREALTDSSTETTFDWLDKLDKNYRTKGGVNPPINRESFKKQKPGMAELVQNAPGSLRTSALPTWNWSNRTIGGIPMIKVSDAYFYDPNLPYKTLHPDYLQYIQRTAQKPIPQSQKITYPPAYILR